MLRPVHVSAIVLTAAALTGCTSLSPSKAERTAAAGPTTRPALCNDLSFPIYFRSGSAELTGPAVQAIRAAADRSKGCAVNDVQVLGLADADGSAAVSQAVSEERARTVARALEAAGLPAPSSAAAGEAGAVNARGQAAPQRRRAEVSIIFKR